MIVETIEYDFKPMLLERLQLVGETLRDEAVTNISGHNGSELQAVDTGQLKGSIGFAIDSSNLSLKVGSAIEYAPYVEFGTGEFADNGQGRKGGWVYKSPKDGKLHFTMGMKPRPFLRTALTTARKKIMDILTND